ncbi:MAG: sensor histidine kinase [Bacteroidota bacterium]
MNFFHPRNWSRYSRKLSGDREGLRKHKRTILVSQFTLFGFFAGVIHAAEDLVDGLVFMPTMDFAMALGVFICYWLNESGRHKLAKIMLLSFLNIFFFIYATLAPQGLGIYLFFFPWVGLAAVVFEIHENSYRLFFIILSVALLVVLFLTKFKAFGTIEFQAINIERSFIINMVSSIVVLVFFIVQMSNMNEYSEKKLSELADEVKTKNTYLQKANRELDRFFYSTAHDLKVPLMDIKGVINTAMAEPIEKKVMEYFVLLKARTQKLDDFLQDVIDYARNVQTGLKTEPTDLERLVSDVIDNFKFIKGADKIRFQKEIALSNLVQIDRVRLMIVLNNILSNAIKYHRLEQRDPWVTIAAHYAFQKLYVSVSDNGQGIDADLVPKIFNMFFRGTNQSKGSGLGLYIVKETVEKMGGSIQVESTLGTGTSFVVSIPASLSTIPTPHYPEFSVIS